MEKQERAMNLKFGVIYAQKGQLTDDEFFSNQETSESFENFLNLLGEKITLKNWDRYRGGLDVHNNMTGTETVYTLFEDHQIMFHVLTSLQISSPPNALCLTFLLPYFLFGSFLNHILSPRLLFEKKSLFFIEREKSENDFFLVKVKNPIFQ